MKKRTNAEYYTVQEYGVYGEFIIGYNVNVDVVEIYEVFAIDSDIDISEMLHPDVLKEFQQNITADRYCNFDEREPDNE